MSDPQIGALRAKLTSRPRSTDYRQRRKDLDALGQSYALASDAKIENVSANGVPAEWASTPGAARDAAILYVHGGGYVIGSLDSHRHLVTELGRAANAVALALDYRLAPEHPFPAAVEDAVAGYRLLLARGSSPSASRSPATAPAVASSSPRWWRSARRGSPSPVAAGACLPGSTWRG